MTGILNILEYYRPYWGRSIFSISASSILEAFDLLTPYIVGQILNVISQQPVDPAVKNVVDWIVPFNVFPPQWNITLIVLGGIIFLSTVGRAPIIPWIGQWNHWNVAFRSARDHYRKTHEKLFALPINFYDENNSGRLSSCITRGIDNHTWVYNEMAGVFLPKTLRLFGIFLVILFLAWPIALVFGLSVAFILWLHVSEARNLDRGEDLVYRYGETTDSLTSELITNIKTVKAFATEALEMKRMQLRFNRQFKVLKEKVIRAYVKLNVLRNSIVQICLFTILIFSLTATIDGQISLGHFVTILTLSNIAFSEIEPLGDLVEYFARRYASMVRFHEFLQEPIGIDATTLNLKSEQSYTFTGKIEYRNLSFGYKKDRLVLQNISLLIQPCKTIAIVGRSGAGKSTFVKLLFRYFDPYQGQIFIDDQDIRDLDITAYRQRLAIVHQDVDVFNGTLLENITYGRPHATQAEVKKACQIANFEQILADLPDGYQTMVGERGVRLSGGQRQRLGIARALVCNPDILVFDEATSSLDYESERSIQLAMRSILGTRTVIIIAHRLSTVRTADTIVVLDKGCIAESGTHSELLEKKGIYYRLHTLHEKDDLLL